MTYQVFFPVVYGNRTYTDNPVLSPDAKVHSFQIGWSVDNRTPLYEYELGLSGGGDQHLLAPENDMQCVQVEELYPAVNEIYNLNLVPHVLTYNKELGRFRYPEEATAWVRNNPGKRYIIGNEPDGDYASGGNDMTEEEFADFYHVASHLIRSADPTAYLIMGAWAGGVAMASSYSHNEDHALEIYYQKYGTMDCQALSWHSYQKYSYNNPYPADKMNKFADYARLWKASGWVDTTDIVVTEFGWYGLDTVNNTPENCIAFMDWYIPQLIEHEQVKAWYWWEWGSGARIMQSGSPTIVGIHYSKLGGAMAQSFIKDPDAVLEYAFDWATNWLATGETIASHTVTVETGITKDSDSESSGVVTVWLSGGTNGEDYDVSCEIVTTAARTDERTIKIYARER